MKILAIGDPHGKLPKNLDRIIKENKIELIICVGDLGFTPEKAWLKKSWKGVKQNYVVKTARDILLKFDSYNIPVLLLRGNMFICESKQFMDKFLKKHKNLIQKYIGKMQFHDEKFIFFDIIYEDSTMQEHHKKDKFTLNRIKKNKWRKEKLNHLLQKNPNSILISHNPPYGYVDKTYSNNSVGSKILLNAVKKYPPKMILCGHIHEAKGKDKIGKTIIYNLGSRGDYAVIDTNKNKILESNFLK